MMQFGSDPEPSEHWEAVRLAWKSLHVPVSTILSVGLLMISVLAISMILAATPAQ